MNANMIISTAGATESGIGLSRNRNPLVPWAGFLLYAILIASASPASLQAQIIDGDPVYNVLPRDAIPAIYDPEFVTGNQARRIMADWEQVIGIVGPEGTAVAYSTWYLDHHEIVDDVVDGLALAVTW